MTTAFVTDTRFADHTMPGHPENADRLTAVLARLEETQLLDQLACLEASPVSVDTLLAVHSPTYLARLERMAACSHGVMLGLDTYIMPASYDVARLAAGAVLRVVDAVCEARASNGLAAVRPPGHHATVDTGMGFCLLNNVAIAARYAQRVHGVDRVLIMDYDVHHGNGTQDIFYTDPSVYYVSTHQFPLYPGTGNMREIGTGAGTGSILNVPLSPGVGDAGYARVFESIIWPAVRRFKPELILVSVGFDAHWADPLANMQLSLAGYDHLSRELIHMAEMLCDGRIVFVLEGGYNLRVLSYGWAFIAHALLGDASSLDPLGPASGDEPPIDQLLKYVRHLHKLT